MKQFLACSFYPLLTEVKTDCVGIRDIPRCLQIPELQEEIFQNLDDDGPSLAALARTCRMVSGSALDVLWGNNGTLYNLMKTISLSLWGEITEMNEYGNLHRKVVRAFTITKRRVGFTHGSLQQFSRIPTTEEWDRFTTYAQRIRTLTLDDGFPLTEPAARTLWKNAPTQVMFPNLRKLETRLFSPEAISSWYSIFVSPNLKDLKVLFGIPKQPPKDLVIDDMLEPLLALIASSCPNLTSFSLASLLDLEVPHTLSKTLSSFICQYDRFEVLEIPTIQLTSRAATHITSLKNLHTLKWSPGGMTFAKDVAGTGFSRLESYEQAPSVSSQDQLALFPSLIFPLFAPQVGIRQLKLDVSFFETGATNLRQIFPLMAEKFQHQSLTTITFQTSHRSIAPNVTFPDFLKLEFPDLKPLFLFRNMQDVTFDLYGFSWAHFPQFNLKDEVLYAMASSWPLLKSLVIQTERTKFTFPAFIALLAGCKELENLKLEVDFRGCKPEDNKPVHPQKLRFHGMHSTIESTDINNAANWFIRNLPNIHSLEWYPANRYKSCWIAVRKLVFWAK